MLLFTMDVGNTNTKCGLWKDDKICANWRFSTRTGISGDELGLMLEGFLRLHGFSFADIADLVIASVVPPMRPSLERFALTYLKKTPIFVEGYRQIMMPVHYTNPRDVGADRVVVSIAAYHRFKRSLIVVDFGTATTFDCISQNGEYLGGAISPGFRLSCEALFQKASRLPKMEIFYKPASVIAKDTINSLNSGLIYGYASLVEGMINRIIPEMENKPLVVATGGLATIIAAEARVIQEVLPDLTMEGLKLVYEAKKWE